MKVNLFSSARRTSYRQEMIIGVAGDEVTLNITASQRRTMRLQVTEEGSVDLRIPLNSSRNEVLRFVKLHEPWLHERLEQVRERLQKRGDALLLYGKERPYVASALGEFLVTDEQVWVPEGWTDAQREKAVEQWLRQEARHEFSYWINHWWPDFSAFAPQQPVLRVKKMKTRWGSLSRKGYINLNLHLLALPHELVELVVVHELCHLRHFDHGPGFRRLLAECLPDWQQREKELHRRGQLLL
ncbi:MAG: hypothetical protein CMI00_06255 [Oceanospirillaceae bacterium]|nr:hypothetical protein [Oceanospirillaceae bacterium]|tara:strand:- start:19 stop:744 length:726 start_codon:yes stop_codon:yes gene_type:complete